MVQTGESVKRKKAVVTRGVRRWVVEHGQRRKTLKMLREQRPRVQKALRKQRLRVLKARRDKRLRDIEEVRAIVDQAQRAYKCKASPWSFCYVAVQG